MKSAYFKQLIKEEILKTLLFENEEPPEGPAINADTPSEPSGYVDKETAKDLIKDTKGRVFTVTFTKKDGTIRVMNCRLGVKKYLKGGTLGYNPVDKGLVPVWDMQKGAYRMVNLNTIIHLKIGGREYTLQNDALKEIKVNKPTPGKFRNNRALYKFLNSRIEEFAEQELQDDDTLLRYTFTEVFNDDNYDWDVDPENFGDEDDYLDNTDFENMPEHIQQALINYLINVGLGYYEEDNDKEYGVSWNMEIGLIYHWTDEPDPGSYDWEEITFQRAKFYVLHFNI